MILEIKFISVIFASMVNIRNGCNFLATIYAI